MARLVLWDIDHTLIENAGVSKEIYAAAFMTLVGHDPEELAPTEGRTDPLIMRDFFRLHGRPEPPWPRVAEALEAAGAARSARLRERGRVLPGAVEGLKALALHSGMHQSVLTGNIRPNARVKLAALGLDELVDLDVGAYGSDHHVRAELVAFAQHRAEVKYGGRFDVTNTVLIGDTPRDVEAGQVGGARVVAVASGLHTVDELTIAGADVVLPDLCDTRRLLAAVLPCSPQVVIP